LESNPALREHVGPEPHGSDGPRNRGLQDDMGHGRGKRPVSHATHHAVLQEDLRWTGKSQGSDFNSSPNKGKDRQGTL
jgi:hypothetical protein